MIHSLSNFDMAEGEFLTDADTITGEGEQVVKLCTVEGVGKTLSLM